MSEVRVRRLVRGFGQNDELSVEYDLPPTWTLAALQRLFSRPSDDLMYDCYPIGKEQAEVLAPSIGHALSSADIVYFLEADADSALPLQLPTLRFGYTVWVRDPRLPVDDQDHEWPAWFVVEASTGPEAASWGDHIASAYSARRGLTKLSSTIEPLESTSLPGKKELPVVPYGHEASDEEIGW